MVRPSFLKFEYGRSRLDLRAQQVWHLSVQMAQKVASNGEKQLLQLAPTR
jgi:hypothetical protein